MSPTKVGAFGQTGQLASKIKNLMENGEWVYLDSYDNKIIIYQNLSNVAESSYPAQTSLLFVWLKPIFLQAPFFITPYPNRD